MAGQRARLALGRCEACAAEAALGNWLGCAAEAALSNPLGGGGRLKARTVTRCQEAWLKLRTVTRWVVRG